MIVNPITPSYTFPDEKKRRYKINIKVPEPPKEEETEEPKDNTEETDNQVDTYV